MLGKISPSLLFFIHPMVMQEPVTGTTATFIQQVLPGSTADQVFSYIHIHTECAQWDQVGVAAFTVTFSLVLT